MENIQKTNVETSAYNKLNFYLRQIRSKTDFIPETAIVLGSGLGNFSDKVKKSLYHKLFWYWRLPY